MLFWAAPNVAIMQFTFARGALCLVLILLYVNRKVKKTLIKPVSCESMPSLSFRSMQGALSVYIGFSSLKFFPVSTVGVICTLKPIIVIIFNKLIFGTALTFRMVLVNALLFFSVCLVIFGTQTSSGEATLEEGDIVTDGAPILAMIALVSQPVLLAGGDIAIKKMAKLPEMLPSAYQNLTLMILAGVYIIVTDLGFYFLQ